MPAGVKELFDIAGEVTTAGSEVPVGGVACRAEADAVAVARLRDAGVILLGRTRTHEYAWGITGRHARIGGVVNPWDRTRIAGGSSAGSAAAVAAGEVAVALGSDTGGSIRIPAAFCGVVGWKPAFGAIPTGGLVPLAPSLDHVGVLARSVGDVALADAVLSGRPRVTEAALAAQGAHGFTVGVATRAGYPRLEPAVEKALDAALAALRDAGAVLRPVRLPDASQVQSVYTVIQRAEAYDVHARVLGTWPAWRDSYGEDLQARLELARQVTPEQVAAAHTARVQLRRETAACFEGLDSVLLPVVPCGPPTVGDPDTVELDGRETPLRDAVLPFTVLANVTGVPALVLPAGLDADGLPVGVQLLGRPGAEAALFAVAAVVEQGTVTIGFPR